MLRSLQSVPGDGFVWADRRPYTDLHAPKKGRVGRYLVPKPTAKPPRTYDVFDQRALFRRLAELKVTESDVLDFANEFGLLGGGCAVRVAEPDIAEPNTFWPGVGEPIEAWRREVSLLHHAVVDLYYKIHAGYAASLKDFVTWEQYRDRDAYGFRAFYRMPQLPGTSPQSICVLEQTVAEKFPTAPKGDIMRPAWLGLLCLVNQEIRDNPIIPELVEIPSMPGRAELEIGSENLIGAIWLQFAHAIAKNPQFKKCEECGTHFETSTDRRTDAKFCNSSCRLRAYRKRHAKGTV